MHENKIFVTQPFLPPLDEFNEYLKKIWESGQLTNNGPFHQEFEKQLADFLKVPYVSLFANGTLALITALQALRITGEVITTPYSFIATTHSLWWNNIKPVFVDIEDEYCNIDAEKIEAAITPRTTAVLPVHVYGNPCNVERIQDIANIYGLKTIYDAAHCFGVQYKGQSVLNFGDLSILSLHATKVFNTMEGGAIICHDKNTKQRIDYLKNFGFAGETKVVAPGINSKMNEMQAALGLLQLKYFDDNVAKRKSIVAKYRDEIKTINGVTCINEPDDTISNYAYFPVFINEKEYGISRDSLYKALKDNNIFARRYFYPLISDFPMYRDRYGKKEGLVVAKKKAEEVICLPLYPDLTGDDVMRITTILKKN